MSRRVADYDYEVPASAVAQVPAAERTDARLLFVRRGGEVTGEGRVPDLVDALRPGDLLVLNEAWVAPARLTAVRAATGGRVSLLLLDWSGRRASALMGTRGTPRAGETLDVDGDRWRLAAVGPEGRVELEVERGRDVATLLAAAGRMPLPPYIRRDPAADPRDALDRERYQTTYARDPGRTAGGGPSGAAPTVAPIAAPTAAPTGASGDAAHDPVGPAVAAPTAGLHLTPALLDDVAARGVTVGRLRLAVGAGTFRPLRGETLDEHEMHAEDYHVPDALAAAYAETRARGGRVVAVGTTVVRALESAVAADGRALAAGPARTGLFITPGHRFAAVDALLTNFHQPRSTLLVLVSAFAGLETIHAAYRRALASGFRLFSYGDAMFLS